MRNYIHFREKVKCLRAKGKTYTEIKKILDASIPKSTLSNWCRDVKIPTRYHQRIKLINANSLKKAQLLAWAKTRAKRQQMIDELQELNKHMAAKIADRDIQKITLAMLYLGEGSKWHSHSGLMLGSSDPSIIQLYIQLLSVCYGITTHELKCRISYRADQNIKALERYWSNITNISLKNFYKTIPDPRTVGKPTRRNDYKGVCVVHGGSTKIQHELEIIPKILLKGL